MAQDIDREKLVRLHAELTDAHQQNPAARGSLGELLPDIKRLVDGPGSGAEPVKGDLSGRLEKVAVQFEADHPTLAASARSLVDLLSEVGI